MSARGTRLTDESEQTEFCVDCGARLRADGDCPRGHSNRGPEEAAESFSRPLPGVRWTWAAFGLLMLGVLVAVAWLYQEQGALRGEVSSSSEQLASLVDQTESLETQLGELNDETAASLDELSNALHNAMEDRSDGDVSDVVDEALASVFTIGDEVGGLGSGFAVARDDDSTILVTNYHVVRHLGQGAEVTVRRDDASWPGTITEVSAAEDLAAITIDAGFTPLPINDAPPDVATQVIAIGSPFGLEGTVTTGVVSAHRTGAIQISAPVSPGNSGGPVLNADGEVVGVATLTLVGGGAQSLNFAVPVEALCRTVVDC